MVRSDGASAPERDRSSGMKALDPHGRSVRVLLAPQRMAVVVAQVEHLVTLLHVGRHDRRVAPERHAGARHLDRVLGIDLYLLALDIPAGSEAHRQAVLVGL